ncbi:MAG: large subunit ribosomal protein [Actinomycetota bacterium]|jgi:large subunit ribosomal protein L10|nr:large subunit ribosomal protein [Actinomycetota bacterium]
MARPEKVQSVQEIAGRFTDAEAALLTEYRGLHVSDIAEVRAALRAADADYKVLKNTLTRIAVREVGLDELVGMLEGPTAIAFIHGDAVVAAKALDEASRKFPVLIIKGGVLQGKVIGSDQAQRLATLESREIQLGKIAMLVNTPLQQMVNLLAAPLRDLGSMLAQVVAKKESGELPAPPPTEAETQAEAAAGSEAEAETPSGTEAAPEAEATAEPAPEATSATEAGGAEAQSTDGTEPQDPAGSKEE